jgi:hypothetical protein
MGDLSRSLNLITSRLGNRYCYRQKSQASTRDNRREKGNDEKSGKCEWNYQTILQEGW